MNRITRLFGSMFFRNLRCLNQVVYFRTILLKSRHICTTTNNFASFSGRVITSPSRTRKLCDVPTATCWKCSYSYSASVNGDAVFFCPSCGVIQELISDRTYFDIMNWYALKYAACGDDRVDVGVDISQKRKKIDEIVGH